jgi:hypothetical protein
MGWEGGKRGEVLDWRGCGAVGFCREECVSTVCTGVSWRVEKEGGEIGIREQGPGKTWCGVGDFVMFRLLVKLSCLVNRY